jgi:stage II sporulation protein D
MLLRIPVLAPTVRTLLLHVTIARRIALTALALATAVPAMAAGRVSIAVLGLFHSRQVVVEALPSFPLLVDSGQRQLVAGVGARQRITVNCAGGKIVAQTMDSQVAGDRIVFEARPGGDAEFFLSVPGKLRRRYRGRLIVTRDARELFPVVEMELETAVASVIAAEFSGAPLEALKAQAVVARSYLISSARRHRYADFCDTTHCQFLREPPPAGSDAGRAARATRSLVLAWKGKPFPAMYSASCGGHTHSLAQAGYAAVDYPYFPVECAFCRRAPDKWSSRLSEDDAAALGSSERARIAAGRKLGWHAVPSNTYAKTQADGAYELSGTGRGHGIGLCQRGAAGMAREGKDFRAILAHYFPNTTVESVTTP